MGTADHIFKEALTLKPSEKAQLSICPQIT
jgi:hypothetical protein